MCIVSIFFFMKKRDFLTARKNRVFRKTFFSCNFSFQYRHNFVMFCQICEKRFLLLWDLVFFLTFFFYFSFLSQNTSTNIHNFILFSVPRKYAGTGDARCPAVVSGHGAARPGEYAGGPGQPPWCSVSRQCSAPRYALGPGRAQRNAHERWPAETYDEVMSVCRIQRIRFILLDPAKTI